MAAVYVGGFDVSAQLAAEGESKLAAVYRLDLQDKSLQDLIGIAAFTKIRALDAGCNKLNNIKELLGLQELQELKLHGNSLLDISGIQRLRNLSMLSLQFNKLENIDCLQTLRKLKVLRVDHNNLPKFPQLPVSLVILDISSNKFESLEGIENLKDLRDLTVAHNNISDLTPLRQCKKLQELNASHNNVVALTFCRLLPALQVLHLEHCKLTMCDFGGIVRRLNTLCISNNKVQSLNGLKNSVPSLESLDIASNAVADEKEFLQLTGLPTLLELSVKDNPCTAKTEDYRKCAAALVEKIPQLEVMDGRPVNRETGRPMSSRGIRPQSSHGSASRPGTASGGGATGSRAMSALEQATVLQSQMLHSTLDKMDDDLTSQQVALKDLFSRARGDLAKLATNILKADKARQRKSTTTAVDLETKKEDSRPSTRGHARLADAKQFAKTVGYEEDDP